MPKRIQSPKKIKVQYMKVPPQIQTHAQRELRVLRESRNTKVQYMKVSKLESKVRQLSKEVEINQKMDRIGSDQPIQIQPLHQGQGHGYHIETVECLRSEYR